MNASELLNRLYIFSQKFNFEEAETLIRYTFDDWGRYKEYEKMDSVFFSLDFGKINSKIALFLIEESEQFQEHLGVRKQFIENCKNNYSDKNLFKYAN
jgi:hypothetical protein